MKVTFLAVAVLLASLAQAKEPKVHHSGTLLQMDSVECGIDENSGKSFVGEMVGPIPPTRKRMPCSARNTFCRETPFCTASVPGTKSILSSCP